MYFPTFTVHDGAAWQKNAIFHLLAFNGDCAHKG